MNDAAVRKLPTAQAAETHRHGTLRECVTEALETYFRHLEGAEPADLYQMVLNEVERPLLEVVMAQVGGNQSRAADALGINRSTLRKKLKTHGLL